MATITLNVSKLIHRLRTASSTSAEQADHLRDEAVKGLEQLSDLLIAVSEIDDEQVAKLLAGVAL